MRESVFDEYIDMKVLAIPQAGTLLHSRVSVVEWPF